MTRTKTTFEDLANLGWPKNNVYNAANDAREGTMRGLGDLSLNDGVAAEWQWWSYNATIGKPYIMSNTPTSTSSEETAWSYDNTQNPEPFEDEWSESWQETVSADLSISAGLTISLEESITIPDVASSGFSMSVSVNSTITEHKERTHTLSHTWKLEVGPYEKLSLIRVITTSTTVTDYGQDFGLAEHSMIGTDGNKWNDHYYWGFGLNGLLNNPTGTMQLQGIGTSISYDFKLVREGPNGKTATPVEHNGKQAVGRAGKHILPIQLATPGKKT